MYEDNGAGDFFKPQVMQIFFFDFIKIKYYIFYSKEKN